MDRYRNHNSKERNPWHRKRILPRYPWIVSADDADYQAPSDENFLGWQVFLLLAPVAAAQLLFPNHTDDFGCRLFLPLAPAVAAALGRVRPSCSALPMNLCESQLSYGYAPAADRFLTATAVVGISSSHDYLS